MVESGTGRDRTRRNTALKHLILQNSSKENNLGATGGGGDGGADVEPAMEDWHTVNPSIVLSAAEEPVLLK